MTRQRLRLRSRSWLHFRRLKTKHYILFLAVGLITTLISFSVTFYRNSDYVMDFIDYVFSRESHTLLDSPYLNTGEYYRPRNFFGKTKSLGYDYYIRYEDFDYRKPETLTYKTRKYSNNASVLFRFPKHMSVSALLLIFHGCKDSAYDWFHTPERQRIIGAAIDLGYACLVFQATDKKSKCWSNHPDIYENKDIQMVFKGLEGFYTDYPELASLPRFTFGSSSGGIFSSIFSINHAYEIQGQILYISIILPEILYTYVKTKNYPPTAWIHMLRDIEFASEERINISKQIFREHQIPHNAFPVEPVQLMYSTFHGRIPSVSIETSRFILYRLQQNQWINNYNFLLYNPRRKLAWNEFLFPSTPPSPNSEDMLKNLNENRLIISEFLNTVYGEHEISYERSFEALKWLKRTYRTSTNQTDSKK